MSKYGLELSDEKGNVTLSISDRLGRFLGRFTVPYVRNGNTKTTKFVIPEAHRGLGMIFLYYNPQWKADASFGDSPFTPDVTIDIVNTQEEITVTVRVVKSQYVENSGQESFEVWYGVF